MRFLAFLLFLLVSLPLSAQDVDALLDSYLTGYWKARPAGAATGAGIHAHDRLLEDLAPAAVEQEIQRNRAALEAFQRVKPEGLPLGKRVDRDIAIGHLNRSLIELASMQRWKHDPRFYTALLRDSVALMVGREFAPAERRYGAISARLRLFPKFLQQARANLDNPPALYTRTAIEQIPEIADLLEKQAPQAAAEQGASRKLQRRVAQDGARAAAALRQFGAWLQSGLLPRSNGAPLLVDAGAGVPPPALAGAPAAAPPASYAQYFRYYLDTELTPDDVRAAAERGVKQAQEEMRRLAEEIAPGRPLPDLLSELSADHPEALKLLPAFRDAVSEAKHFVQEQQLVSLPQADRLHILPAPLYRNPALAWLDPPGPFEPDLPWCYYVAPIDRFPPGEAEENLRAANRFALTLAAARDVYPGGYLQGEAMNRSPNLARKVFGNPAFIAGWALYSEQMVLEASGFGFQASGSAPESRRAGRKPEALFGAHRALLAALDAIVDIRLHAAQMTTEEAKSVFVQEGWLDARSAEQRVERCLLSPVEPAAGYAGKLEILRLREEMQKKQGPAFILKEFHDRLLALGAPPVRFARELLLAEEKLASSN